MVQVKILGDGGVHIIDDNMIYMYDKFGTEVGINEVVSPMQSLGFQKLPIISVLATSAGSELLYQNALGVSFKKASVLKGTSIIMKLMMKSPLRVISRKGVECDVKYSQSIMVFNSTVDVEDLVNSGGF